MPEENKSVNDLYRELIDLQTAWREETKQILEDDAKTVATLGSMAKRFDIWKWILPVLVVIAVIVCISALIWNDKLRICSISYGEFAITTPNCFYND